MRWSERAGSVAMVWLVLSACGCQSEGFRGDSGMRPLRLAFYNGTGTFVGLVLHKYDMYEALANASKVMEAKFNRPVILTNFTEVNLQPPVPNLELSQFP
eukprot:m.150814 g.150814  ORF g.150814 m.150814 type:complete len:100 (+) comp14273_c0_seq4:131-430(+)